MYEALPELWMRLLLGVPEPPNHRRRRNKVDSLHLQLYPPRPSNKNGRSRPSSGVNVGARISGPRIWTEYSLGSFVISNSWSQVPIGQWI